MKVCKDSQLFWNIKLPVLGRQVFLLLSLAEQGLLKEKAIFFDTNKDVFQNPFICIEALTNLGVNLNCYSLSGSYQSTLFLNQLITLSFTLSLSAMT